MRLGNLIGAERDCADPLSDLLSAESTAAIYEKLEVFLYAVTACGIIHAEVAGGAGYRLVATAAFTEISECYQQECWYNKDHLHRGRRSRRSHGTCTLISYPCSIDSMMKQKPVFIVLVVGEGECRHLTGRPASPFARSLLPWLRHLT